MLLACQPSARRVMRTSPKSGFYYAAASVPLMGAGVYLPDVFHLSVRGKEIAFFACLAAAFVCVLIGAFKEIQSKSSSGSQTGRAGRMIPIFGMLVCGLGFIVFAGVYFWPSETTEPMRRPYQSLTNSDLRENVFTLGDALRKLELRYEALRPPELNPSQLPVVTDEQQRQRAKDFSARQQLMQELYFQKRAEFKISVQKKGHRPKG